MVKPDPGNLFPEENSESVKEEEQSMTKTLMMEVNPTTLHGFRQVTGNMGCLLITTTPKKSRKIKVSSSAVSSQRRKMR